MLVLINKPPKIIKTNQFELNFDDEMREEIR